MAWHYQIRKRILNGKPWYDIVEYFIGKPYGDGWTKDGCTPGGETRAELIRELEMMLSDAKKYKPFIDTENENGSK